MCPKFLQKNSDNKVHVLNAMKRVNIRWWTDSSSEQRMQSSAFTIFLFFSKSYPSSWLCFYLFFHCVFLHLPIRRFPSSPRDLNLWIIYRVHGFMMSIWIFIQKTNFLHHVQHNLARLYLVNKTIILRNHKKSWF